MAIAYSSALKDTISEGRLEGDTVSAISLHTPEEKGPVHAQRKRHLKAPDVADIQRQLTEHHVGDRVELKRKNGVYRITNIRAENAGYQPLNGVEYKPRHAELRATNPHGEEVELHLDVNGDIYKERHRE